jgi:hypothetical protein
LKANVRVLTLRGSELDNALEHLLMGGGAARLQVLDVSGASCTPGTLQVTLTRLVDELPALHTLRVDGVRGVPRRVQEALAHARGKAALRAALLTPPCAPSVSRLASAALRHAVALTEVTRLCGRAG